MASAASAAPARANARQVWRLLRSTSRPLAAAVIAWIAASAVVPALVVIALGAVVGEVPAAIRDGLGSAAGARLIEALAVAALVYALSLVLDPVGAALGTAVKTRITGRLQERLLAAVARPVGIDHLEDAEVLDRLSRAEGSLTGFFPGDAPVTWAGILAARISGIVGCAFIAHYHWWLGLMLFVMWLLVRRLMLGAIVRQATEMRGQTASMRRAWYLTGVGQKARDAKEVRVFGLGGFVAGRFREAYNETIRGAEPGLREVHRKAATGYLVVLLAYFVTLGVIAHDALNHRLDVGMLATLLPMLSVTMSTGSVSVDDITLAYTLTAIPDADSLEADLGSGETLRGDEDLGDRPRRDVVFEGVGFAYPGGESNVLDGVDLALGVGTSTAIVGANGAGKSTLVSLLSRLHDPTSGRIHVDGTDVRAIDPQQWRRAVAVMPQEPARFPVSAFDNIAFGSLSHREDRDGVEAAARLSGFSDVVASLPDGWDTVLSRALPGGVDLSGGQWQRLALARALFATRHGARLLVLDEPTAALDVRAEARFYERFLEITEGLTTVIISHRFATVRRADTICVLDGGRITERGTHEELLAAGGAYARLYQVQARRFGGGK